MLSSLTFLAAALAMLPQSAPGVVTPLLEEILSPGEYQKYLREAKYKSRIDIYRKGYDQLASQLRSNLKQKKIQEVEDYLAKIRALSQYALEDPSRKGASTKDQRSKQVKKLEIRLRELLSDLEDLRLSVPADYRVDFDTTSAVVDRLRDRLLQQLFGVAPP